jgi:hypothetical protein
MKKYYLFVLLLFIGKFCFSIGDNYNKIIYLSDSSLFIYDLKTQSSVRFSSESDRIVDFMVSPNFKYVAYSRVIGSTSCAGGFEDDTASIPVISEAQTYSVKIFDLEQNILLKEILPTSDEFINLNKWISPNEILCTSGDCEVFNGWIKYTINDSVRRFGDDYTGFNSIIGVSKDSEYKFYLDDSNVLHKFNFLSKTDLELPNSKNGIIDCEQSNNKKFISWLEAVDNTKTDSKTGSVSYSGTTDKMTLFSVSSWKKTEIFSGKASRITSGKYLTFSPNDSIATIETAKEIRFINIYTSEKFLIYGHNIGWIDSNTCIYSNFGCIFQYDIRLKKSKLIIDNSVLAYVIK